MDSPTCPFGAHSMVGGHFAVSCVSAGRAHHTSQPLQPVFTPKYRRKVFFGEVRERPTQVLREACLIRDWVVLGTEVMPDHAHPFLSAPPRWSPSDVAKILKGVSARRILREFPRQGRRSFVDALLLRGECREHLSATSSPSASVRWTVAGKAFKYRLYPTRPQLRDLDRTLTLCRRLYNAALQERREAYRKAGKTAGFTSKNGGCPGYAPSCRSTREVLQNVIERVDEAFQGFFRRVKSGQKAGYPRFKGQGRYDSFTFPQAGTTGVKLQEGGKRVLLFGVGSVKVRLHRPNIKTATVKREGEHWYVVFCEVEPSLFPPTTGWWE